MRFIKIAILKGNIMTNWKKSLAFAASCGFCLVAFAAQRKVTIPVGPGGVELVNGSPVTVTFNAVCYDTSGASILSSNGATLAAKQKATFATPILPTCGSTNTVGQTFQNGMISCEPQEMHPEPLDNCGTGYHLCTVAEFGANKGASYATTDAFLSSSGLTSWGYNSSNTSPYDTNWHTVTGGADSVPVASWDSTDLCSPNSIDGSGTQVSACTFRSTSAGPYGNAMCCPDGPVGTASVCEITIDGSTPANGHLQSPQFKGGANF